MYNLLVVDDEIYAVRGIMEGINWEEVDIKEVYSAYNAEEAIEIIQSKDIDVIICDIEMPGLDGIKLLERINKGGREIYTIFLTGHAKFDYAQQAIKLGCFDYLLKPIDHDKIKETVSQALKKLKVEKSREEFLQTYKKYYNFWQKQQPLLVERFWQDVLSQRIINTRTIKNSLSLYEIPLAFDSKVIPILMSIEEWEVQLSGKDEEIMKYALRKTALEILKQDSEGVVFQNYDGNNLIIIYAGNNSNPSPKYLKDFCQKIIKICREKLHCILSCYIGKPSFIQDLDKVYKNLLEIEKNCINQTNNVVLQAEYNNMLAEFPPTPPFQDWQILFELGKGEELVERIDRYLLENKLINSEALENFYFGFLHMIYEVMHQRGISIKKIYNVQDLNKLLSYSTIPAIRKEVRKIILTGTSYLNKYDDSNPVIIEKIQNYIKENFKEDISRKKIANFVSLNPSYLSRLFKKEMGLTLTEYITELRLKEAKKLLIETEKTITIIAEEVGYKNYSYFSKIFKEEFGVTPWEYKKNYQKDTEHAS